MAMKPKHTPLYPLHQALGARTIEFAGWEMPLQYSGILAEHQAVRTCAGLFDLSHMGEVEVSGPQAGAVCQELLVTDVSRLQETRAQYSLLCYPNGGIVDDVVLYRREEQTYFFCVNAANTDKDFLWMQEQNRGRAEVVDRSLEYVLLALQGPRAEVILQKFTPLDLSSLKRFWSAETQVAGARALLARTGYTGEDGFEVFLPAQRGAEVWSACLEQGRQEGLVPVGLGARDTLRLEAGLLLSGSDITRETTPLEAGLERLVQFDKEDFIGRAALLKQKMAGVKRKLVGLEMVDPGIPRRGYALFVGDQQVGQITSGGKSPTLGKAIGLGYVAAAFAAVGSEVEVQIRGRRAKMQVVEKPFYRRGRQR
jgi:aminomethyltransferase